MLTAHRRRLGRRPWRLPDSGASRRCPDQEFSTRSTPRPAPALVPTPDSGGAVGLACKALTSGGSKATWRTRARMLPAPVLSRMLPIWVRMVARAHPLANGDLLRREVGAQALHHRCLGQRQVVTAGEPVHRQFLADLALAQQHGDAWQLVSAQRRQRHHCHADAQARIAQLQQPAQATLCRAQQRFAQRCRIKGKAGLQQATFDLQGVRCVEVAARGLVDMADLPTLASNSMP